MYFLSVNLIYIIQKASRGCHQFIKREATNQKGLNPTRHYGHEKAVQNPKIGQEKDYHL